MATTSTQQDRAFLSAMFPSNLLEEAIEFIKNNFRPEDIFEKEVLEEWAEDNEYIKNQE